MIERSGSGSLPLTNGSGSERPKNCGSGTLVKSKRYGTSTHTVPYLYCALRTCPVRVRRAPRRNRRRRGRDERRCAPSLPAAPWPSPQSRPAQTSPQNPSTPPPCLLRGQIEALSCTKRKYSFKFFLNQHLRGLLCREHGYVCGYHFF
jgi:hypothetical protein